MVPPVFVPSTGSSACRWKIWNQLTLWLLCPHSTSQDNFVSPQSLRPPSTGVLRIKGSKSRSNVTIPGSQVAEHQGFLQGKGLGLVPFSQKTLLASFKTRNKSLMSCGPGPSLTQLDQWSPIQVLPPAPARIPQPVLSAPTGRGRLPSELSVCADCCPQLWELHTLSQALVLGRPTPPFSGGDLLYLRDSAFFPLELQAQEGGALQVRSPSSRRKKAQQPSPPLPKEDHLPLPSRALRQRHPSE